MGYAQKQTEVKGDAVATATTNKIWSTDREQLRHRATIVILWGVALAALGIAILAWPHLTGAVLVSLIGAMILVAGIFLAYGSWKLHEVAGSVWVAALIPSLAVAVFGGVVLFYPEAVGAVLLVVVAILVLIAGLGDLFLGFGLIPIVPWWWLRVLRGILMIGAAIWALTSDISGLAAIGVAFGIWALLLAVITITSGILALRK